MRAEGTLTCQRCGRETPWPFKCDCKPATNATAPSVAEHTAEHGQLARQVDAAALPLTAEQIEHDYFLVVNVAEGKWRAGDDHVSATLAAGRLMHQSLAALSLRDENERLRADLTQCLADAASDSKRLVGLVDEKMKFFERNVELKSEVSRLRAELAAARLDAERSEQVLQTLRRYTAVEGDDHKGKFVALAYDGSILGPTGRDDYPLYEFAESVEKWLHEKIDKAREGR